MTTMYYGAGMIASPDGGYEPQRKNNFTLLVEAPSSIGDVGLIQMSLHSFPLPKEVKEVITIPFGNEQRKVAGKASFPDINLVVTDYVDQDVLGVLKAWRKLVYDPATGQIGWAEDYKGSGSIYMFGPDGTPTDDKGLIWNLRGMWPSKLDPGDPTMENANPVRITTTFVIDYMQRADWDTDDPVSV